MDYNSTLKAVRVQYPDLTYKEQQKLASKTLSEHKEKLEKLDTDINTDKAKPKKGKAEKAVSADLVRTEENIRRDGVNRHRIILYGKQVMPDGELVKHEKVGPNTLVTFEDKKGNRLPVNGYFKIFI